MPVPAASKRLGWGWPCLGLAGSLAVACGATRLLRHRPVHWWWQFPLPGGHGTAWHVFWGGIVVLCVAWIGLGFRLRSAPATGPRDVVLVAALWAVPLALAPALFSLDTYSYLAQGALLHHGLNPYRTAPAALARWHETGMLAAVGNTWRHTPAPYGPLFMLLASWVAAVAGHHLTLGVTLLRVPELIGVGLLGVCVPRLARATGADPARAVWLAVASPLMLLYLIGGGHNDALMTGLLVAGVTVAIVDERPLLGIAVCALAATVKLPAIAGAGLIGVCWLRAEQARWRTVLVEAAAVGAGVLVAVGVLAGVGLSWLSGSVFSNPEAVRMALTPSTALSVGVAHASHALLGVHVRWRALQSIAGPVGFALVGAFGVWVASRVRYERLVGLLGLLLLAAALGGPAAWPWYLCWGVALLAAAPRAQRSRWLAVAVVAASFPVMAGGQVAIALPDASRMLFVYAAAALVAVVAFVRGRRARVALPHVPVPHPPVRSPRGVARAEGAG
jgi:hypothetical protein